MIIRFKIVTILKKFFRNVHTHYAVHVGHHVPEEDIKADKLFLF